jgi:hypothetical protein
MTRIMRTWMDWMVTRLFRLRFWLLRYRTERELRELRRIIARHQGSERTALARARLETALRLGDRRAVRDDELPHARVSDASRSPPASCCDEYGIVTECDGVTDTVVCGICRSPLSASMFRRADRGARYRVRQGDGDARGPAVDETAASRRRTGART